MLDEDRIGDLVVQWGQAWEQGQELSVDELCRDSPELKDEVAKRVQSVKDMSWLNQFADDSSDDLLHLPDFKTVLNQADETQLPACSLSIEEFATAVVESGLMDADQVQQLRNNQLADDARSLARHMVETTKLTRFQASVLLGGGSQPLLLDRYIILDEIGSGGMGAVFKALHQQMDRVVALKILPKAAFDSSDKVKRFQREVQAAAKLEHPNIVTAFDAHESEGVHFLVMSYVDGHDLAETVRRQGPLSAARAVKFITQAAKGLEHAHNLGIVHRDIKPANLLLDKMGTVKILDMGLALIENADPEYDKTVSQELTQTGMVMGTVAYLSPEQALDTHNADGRSDIYSMGCTLYYLLNGKAPYNEDTMMKTIMAHREANIPSLYNERRKGGPEELNAIFQKMVAKQPEDRFQNMADVISALAELEIEDDQEAQPLVAVSSAMHETASFIDTSRDVILPQPLQQMGATGSTRLKLLIFTTVAALMFLAAIIYHILTNNGTITVELADESIVAKLATSGVIIEDGDRKWTINIGDSHKLPTGETYSARLPKKSGLILTVTDGTGTELDIRKFQIRRSGKILVKVATSATALDQSRSSESGGVLTPSGNTDRDRKIRITPASSDHHHPGQVLVSRPSDLGTERGYEASTSIINADARITVYDLIQIPTDGKVGTIEWDGIYISMNPSANPPPATAYEFLITIVEDAGGVPGSKPLPGSGSFQFTNAGGSSTISPSQNDDSRSPHSQITPDEVSETFVDHVGFTLGGTPPKETSASWHKYRITLSNPIQLEADEKYWMSIVAKSNTKDRLPSWCWTSGSDPNASKSSLQRTGEGEYRKRSGNRSFSIFSSSVRQNEGNVKVQTTDKSQDAALTAIKELGGTVRFDEKDSDKPVIEIDLADSKATDSSLVHLSGLTNLQKLNLTETQVTDAGLVHLKGLTNLQTLTLHKTPVTPTGVKDIQSALPRCRIGPADALVSRSSDLGTSRGVEASPSIINDDDHALVYDSIKISTHGNVAMLEWEGFYFSAEASANPPPATAYEFLVTLVEDAGGVPGTKPLPGSGSFKVSSVGGSSATSHPPNRESYLSNSQVTADEVSETFVRDVEFDHGVTPRKVTLVSWYKYRLTLSNPIRLKANKKYWMSIAAKSNTKHRRPEWSWTSGHAQNASGASFQRWENGKYHRERSRNRSFSIFSSGVRQNEAKK